jgi:hypothetical protein
MSSIQTHPYSALSTQAQKIVMSVLNSISINPNPYSAFITRQQPSALVFLLDQSGSMSETTTLSGIKMSKSEALAKVVNQLLRQVLFRSTKGNEIREYFDVAFIGYGEEVSLLLEPQDLAYPWIKLSELPSKAIRKELVEIEQKTRTGVKIIQQEEDVWIDAYSDGQTPMRQALALAQDMLKVWIEKHPESFPPVVFNLTDGAATDAKENELLAITKNIRDLHTQDGNVLLFNCHLGNSGEGVALPASKSELPNDEYAHLLYACSSYIPDTPHFKAALADFFGKSLNGKYVAMSYNADMKQLINILNIGSSNKMQ